MQQQLIYQFSPSFSIFMCLCACIRAWTACFHFCGKYSRMHVCVCLHISLSLSLYIYIYVRVVGRPSIRWWRICCACHLIWGAIRWPCRPVLDVRSLLHVGHWKSAATDTDNAAAQCRLPPSCRRWQRLSTKALQAVLVRARYLFLSPAALSKSFGRVPLYWMLAWCSLLTACAGFPAFEPVWPSGKALGW